MSEQGPRTGAARDVPPPRPVRPVVTSGPDEDVGPLGRAARAVADAVSGLVDGAGGRSATGQQTDSRSPATGLGDVVGAVVGALGNAWGRREPNGDRRDEPGAADRTPGAMLGDLLASAAPRLPIRDREALRHAYPGATDAEIADALVARAARLTAAIGAATGGVVAVQWLATPSLLAVPLQLGAEAVITAAVEVVLIGELHELHGRPAVGDPRSRASAYLTSWSEQQALDRTASAGLGSLLGAAGLATLRRQVGRRVARVVPSAAPFMIGAAWGGRANRRATEKLAARVRAGLEPGRRAPDR